MFQVTVIVDVLVVLVALAVNMLVVLPNTVGVPVTALPTMLNPVGKAFAVYVIADPAALAAVNVVLVELPWFKLIVAPFAGLDQVTASGLTVIVYVRVTSWFCPSLALTPNV